MFLWAAAVMMLPTAAEALSRSSVAKTPVARPTRAPIYEPIVEKSASAKTPPAWYEETIQEEQDLLEDNSSLLEALNQLQKSTGSDVLQSD